MNNKIFTIFFLIGTYYVGLLLIVSLIDFYESYKRMIYIYCLTGVIIYLIYIIILTIQFIRGKSIFGK